MGRQHIVMVGQRQVFPGGQRRGGVGVGGDALVLDLPVDNAAVPGGPFLNDPAHLAVGVIAGVHQHQLPVGRRLALHTVEELLQKPGRRVIERRQDADGGPLLGVLSRLGALGFQRLFGGQISCPLAEEPPLEKARGPGDHDTQPLLFRQGAGVAEQFLDAFGLLAHGISRAGRWPDAPYSR